MIKRLFLTCSFVLWVGSLGAIGPVSGGGGAGGAPTGSAGGDLGGSYPNPTVPTLAKVYNVKSYGAVGNGSTNDTAAIQAAIDACDAANGGTVYFPNGNYNQTGIVLGSSGTGQHYISLVGESQIKTVIRYTGSTSGIAIYTQTDKFSNFKNFYLLNTVAKGTTAGLVTAGPSGSSGTQSNGNFIEQVTIDGFHYGWSTTETGGSTSSEIPSVNLVLQNNDEGFRNTSFNGLNFVFINLQTSSNGTGVNCNGGGSVHVFGGAGSGNTVVDFAISSGGNFTIHGFRSETSLKFLTLSGPYGITITSCTAQALTGATAITFGTNNHLSISDSLIGGDIQVLSSSTAEYLDMRNTVIKSTSPLQFANSVNSGGYNIRGSYTCTGDDFSTGLIAIPDRQGSFTNSVMLDSVGSISAPIQALASTVGNPVSVTASNATAGSTTAGAAAGGSVNIAAGNAARLTSGNGLGGDLNLSPGIGIGNNGGGLPGSGKLNLKIDATSGIGGVAQYLLLDGLGANTSIGIANIAAAVTFNLTSGGKAELSIGASYHPTSTSTMTAIPLLINPVINYSAGTPGAGHYEALKIAVTETALPTGTNYLIRGSAGAAGTTDVFTVRNDGATSSLYERFGSGTPEANVTAPIGAVYHRTDGGAATSFYVKESGAGNTGWIAK